MVVTPDRTVSLLDVLPWDDGGEERRRLRVAAVAALALHVGFFAVRWSAGPMPVPVAEPPRTPFVVRLTRLTPPEPPVVQPVERPPVVERATVSVPAPPSVDPAPLPVRLEPLPPPVFELPTGGIEIAIPAPPPPPVVAGPERFDPSTMTPPVRISGTMPAYTEPARRVRRQGEVVLEAVIDVEGRLVDARVLKGLGLGLDEAALRAVADWRFEPARRGDRALPVVYVLQVRYRLQ